MRKHLKIWTAAFLFVFSGCASGPSKYDQELETKKQQAFAETYDIDCPSKHGFGKCGLIAEAVYAEIPAFTRDVCGGSWTKECSHRFGEMLFAKWQLRYPHADWGAADTWCRANPTLCNFSVPKSAEMFEMELMGSHNQAILESFKNQRDSIQIRAEQDRADRLRLWQSAFRTGPSVNCTSNTVGSFTNTQCH